MLSISDIILIGLVFMIIGILFFDTPKKNNKNEKYSPVNSNSFLLNNVNDNQHKQLSQIQMESEDSDSELGHSQESLDSERSVDLNSSEDSSHSKSNQANVVHHIKRKPLNPNFLNIQFHNDYRDLMTAIHNIIPERRQRFNVANIPITYSENNEAGVS